MSRCQEQCGGHEGAPYAHSNVRVRSGTATHHPTSDPTSGSQLPVATRREAGRYALRGAPCCLVTRNSVEATRALHTLTPSCVYAVQLPHTNTNAIQRVGRVRRWRAGTGQNPSDWALCTVQMMRGDSAVSTYPHPVSTWTHVNPRRALMTTPPALAQCPGAPWSLSLIHI